MKNLLLIILGLFSLSFYAQEYTYIDFSNTNTTSGNWNNVVAPNVSQSGQIVNLFNDYGTATGGVLTVTDAFYGVNENGTTSPTTSIFPSSATRDSFYGSTQPWNGVTETTGGFEITGLDPAKYYSFKIFASRTGVSDNRETQYTVTGSNTLTSYLNTSNNTGDTANILNILPDATGKITLSVTKGPNNNNSYGFYYLGAIQMIKTSSPYSDTTNPTLSLVYPNGGETWHATSTPYISWDSQDLTENVNIEYSLDNGTTWSQLTTVAANIKKYVWTIPYVESNQCKVRITSGTLSDESENPFSIIPNTDRRFKIVVLGSSTAAGTGPSSVNKAWVWMYTDYLKQHDTRFDVTNLAVGGYTTYDILPTGTTIPAGVNETIDTNRNITKAIALNADGIIVNMPSNDANMGYSVANQMSNFNLLQTTATNANIPIWICNVQPRNFAIGSNSMNIQLQMSTEIPTGFPSNNIDFWTGIANSDGTVNALYNAGDGVHLNDAGHLVLLDRVIGSGLHTIVKNGDDNEANVVYNYRNFLIDFNFNSTQTPSNTNWTNMSNVLNEQASNLVDDLGGISSYSIKISDAFYIGNEWGTQTPVGTIPFPISATRDSFVGYTSDTGQFTIAGLDPNKKYSFTIFASRDGLPIPQPTTDVRTGLYNAQGINSVTVALDAYNNTSNVAVLPNVEPTATGEIILNVLKSSTNTNVDGLFYINCLKMTEFTPAIPDVLLDAEDGTTNRLAVLNVFSNGPGQSNADMVVVDNPNPSGINTSSKVVKFTRRTSGADAASWAGFYSHVVDPDPDFTENKYVHVKVLKSKATGVRFKIENGVAGTVEKLSVNSYTQLGEWQDMVIDFSEKTGTYATVGLQPDFEDPLIAEGDRIIYFDDIVINSNPNPQTLGISENSIENKIFIYPNPASKEININSEVELLRIDVFNVNGALINKHYINTTSNVKLNVSNLTNGIYFFTFVSANGSTDTKKIIITDIN